MLPSLTLTHEAYQRICEYGQRTGQSYTAAASRAINEWMDCNGDAVLEELDRRRERGAREKRRTTAQVVPFRRPGSRKGNRKVAR